MRRNKFNAKPTSQDGHLFASKAEAKRYGELKLLERAGQIKAITIHPAYTMIVNGEKIGRYTGDFAYFEGNKYVVEDVKSWPTKTEAYGIRVKLFKALYPDIDHREIGT